ncbi:oxidoreductase DltE [Penicillium subrubescens]|uniref:oxidoreductase DltE n=1 Tax=Penicillium subrubescens TaxID=1316194 RepID=UPI002545B78B|nr:oxidoreductase DltE [Penicillium subrubescens]KAJ5883735.1 oxidoreductase DltE [Penicillium subrubescens]
MSERIRTILILGAAKGIGEAMARRFHHLGKTVIVTGRQVEEDQLAQLAEDLPGLEYRVWDLTHLETLGTQVQRILTDFPTLDTVFVNAGIQSHYQLFQDPPPDHADVLAELMTNLAAPILVAHAFAHHLLAQARAGTPTTLFLTSSSLAYFPVAFYPVYCATKAGIAAFTKSLRAQLQETGCAAMNIVEVVPPYVDTELNAAHRWQTDRLQGGPDKAVQPMPLEQYIDQFFRALQAGKGPDGSLREEIGVGFGARGAEVWRDGWQRLLRASGMAE